MSHLQWITQWLELGLFTHTLESKRLWRQNKESKLLNLLNIQDLNLSWFVLLIMLTFLYELELSLYTFHWSMCSDETPMGFDLTWVKSYYTNIWSVCQLKCTLPLKQKRDVVNTNNSVIHVNISTLYFFYSSWCHQFNM